jgi:hypothetical protein
MILETESAWEYALPCARKRFLQAPPIVMYGRLGETLFETVSKYFQHTF